MDDTGNAVQVQAASGVSHPRSPPWVDPALLAGRTGRWRWYWVLLGAIVILPLFFGISLAMSWVDVRIARLFGPPLAEGQFVAGRPDSFLAMVTFAATFIVPTALVLLLVHDRSWRYGLGAQGRFDWPMFAKAAAAYFIVTAAFLLLEYAKAPSSFRLVPHGIGHIPWLLLGALVILPQAFAEDYIFKGYFMRAWGALVPVRIVVATLCAGLFTSLHAINQDVGTDLWFNLISMFLEQVLIFLVFARTGNIASAFGMHWMTNVIAFCLITKPQHARGDFALIEWLDPVLRSGGSRLASPLAWIEFLASLVLLWALVSWPRSPFYLPSATFPAAPAVATDAQPTAAPPSAPEAR